MLQVRGVHGGVMCAQAYTKRFTLGHRCQQPGHNALQCPKTREMGLSLDSCFKCGLEVCVCTVLASHHAWSIALLWCCLYHRATGPRTAMCVSTASARATLLLRVLHAASRPALVAGARTLRLAFPPESRISS